MSEVVLRAMSVGELLDKAFRIYRSKFALLIGIVAVVMIPETVIRLLVTLYSPVFGNLVNSLMQVFISSITVLALMVFVSRTYLGRDVGFGESFSFGMKRYWSAIGASLLMGLAIGLPVGVLIACGGLTLGLNWIVIILALPGVVYLITKWSLAISAVVLEDMGASDGLRRSWNLTEGHFWRVLGTSFAASLLTYLVALLPSLFGVYLLGFLNLDSDIVNAVNILIDEFATLIAMPFAQAVTVLIYYDLRIRKEGFDLQVLADASNEPIVSAE